MGDRQIAQMCKFIKQEAKEKANEIAIKTNHDFNKEKQLKVLNAKKKIDAAFASKMERLDSDKKVERSKAVGATRRKKGICAHELVQKVKDDALTNLEQQIKSNPSGYEKLMTQILVESITKLNEVHITVECLPRDAALVTKLIPASLSAYKEAVKAQHKEDPTKYETQLATSGKCSVSLDSSRPLSEKLYIGGVKCVGLNGRIVCDNTLNTRLALATEALLPTIRSTLFPQLA
eukprot:g5626.t1